ncbi:MAG TPA: glycosyltransferase family 2 protein [Steroidobacteraceae bacterium]|nr:glycosyltransferase family 2 protein [Steroidobacteraceae bacterium]
MSRQPWLSILVPVYNVAPYLRECVESMLPQIGPGVELLLLEDGSTDESPRICTQLQARHAAVGLLRHERNRGLSAARNTLLEAATGQYLWFVDSDDRMLPGAVARLRPVIARHQPDMVLCGYREGRRIRDGFSGAAHTLLHDREALVHGVFTSRRMYSWNRIVRRELWGTDLRFPAGRYFEDIMTTPWLCLRARSFYYADEPWIDYRQRGDSIMALAMGCDGSFDRRMNDDLAGALGGFRAAAAASLPQMSTATALRIAEFCGRSFSGIGWRLLRARLVQGEWRGFLTELRRYRALCECDSPAEFRNVIADALRERRLKIAVALGIMLLLSPVPRPPLPQDRTGDAAAGEPR